MSSQGMFLVDILLSFHLQSYSFPVPPQSSHVSTAGDHPSPLPRSHSRLPTKTPMAVIDSASIVLLPWKRIAVLHQVFHGSQDLSSSTVLKVRSV
ncbi:hypothetical protein B296_00045260 [Ensete ventricosum]|uniref:Uncharacterized protein n=1 Tax=Ensete ventricosum TaxID=4639 RepID=A0A426XPY4_ENSVE|nr:hypothetical protein B296_00045260 [Ensete ventricosum]